MNEIVIDSMTAGDWEAVRAIYLEGIATGDATFETEAPSWETWDAAHLTFPRLVARAAESLIGWAALSPVSQRKAYAGVAEAVSMWLRTIAKGESVNLCLSD